MRTIPLEFFRCRISPVLLAAGLLLLCSGCLLTKTRRDPLYNAPQEFSCGEQYPGGPR